MKMISAEDTDGLVIELQGISSLSADNTQWRIEIPNVFSSLIVVWLIYYGFTNLIQHWQKY